MNTLIIDIPFNKDEFIKDNLFRLKLVHKPLTRQTIGVSITTALFLVITLLLYSSDGKFNPFFIITSIFGIITFLFIQILLSSKKKYKIKIQDLASEYEAAKLDCRYEITEDGINYSDNEKTMNFKWKVFKYFIIHNEYLIVSLDETVENAYFFTRHEIPADTFESLLLIVKSKLSQRKIK